LLLGRDSGGRAAVTDLQGRAQFSMWAVMAAPMLLSQNVRNLTKFQLDTYLNKEVIAVSQDPEGRAGQKLWGGDLGAGSSGTPPLTLSKCNPGSSQTWKWNVSAPFFITNTETNLCANVDNCGTKLIGYHCVTTGGTCAGPNSYANEQFYTHRDGTLRSGILNHCVTQNGVGSATLIAPCTGAANQKWTFDSSTGKFMSGGGCLTVGSGVRANIWGRPLEDGSWAIAFINAESTALDLTCDINCLSATGWEADQILSVRDLWAHANLPNTNPTMGLSVKNLAANGGIALFRVKPVWG